MFVKKISELREYIQLRTNGKCYPPWNWLCVKLLSILAKYPSGISKAIILAEIQQSWNTFSQNQGRLEGHKRRKVTVDNICENKHIRRDSILDAIIDSVQTVPGTNTKLAVLRDDTDRSKHTIDMYLHQKLYPELLTKRRLRFTSCRVLQGTRSQRLRLLPTENMVIVAESFEELPSNFSSLEAFENGDITQPHYGTNVAVEVAGLGTEETVHLANGETTVKINVTVTDSSGIHADLELWDEQVPMVSLFKEGDTLAIQQPFVVPSATERYTLQYGPATVIHCLSCDQAWEMVQSQVKTQCTPVSVSKDSQGKLDYSTYPERIFIADHRSNMSHVTLFCTVVEIGMKELLKQGSKFEIMVQDGTGTCSVTICDHNNSYWASLYPGQCVVMEGLHSLGSSLALQNQHGGRLWNVSALAGWLATKFLCSLVPLADAVHNSNCVCQAAITGVDSTACCVRKEHVTCGSEVTSCTAQPVTCQACDVSHLTEIPNKPSLQTLPSHYWQWRFNMSVTLRDTQGSIQANLTQQTAQELLQLPAAQFAEHINRGTQDQILEAMLDAEYLFGLTYFNGKFQIDAVSLINVV